MDSQRLAKRDRSRERSVPESRLIVAVLAVLMATAEVLAQRDPDHVTVIGPRGRQTIAISLFAGGIPMIPLDELAPLVNGSIRSEVDSATLAVGARSVAVYSGRSLVLMDDGNKPLLSTPVTVRGNRWFVPLDFLGRVLPLLTDEKINYRADERLLVLGEGFPELHIRSMVYPNYTRVVMESSSAIDFQVNQTGSQVQVLIQAPYLDTDFESEEIRDGVVETMSLDRLGDAYLLTVELGERFGTLKAFENPERLVIDFFRSRVPAGPTVPVEPSEEPAEPVPVPVVPPEPSPPDLAPAERGELRIIALDPGHGGAETGAQGPSGLLEKEVTLSLARHLRTVLENRLGVRVVFTRDGDRNLPLDERTAIANNNKSDLFISIHVNASPRPNARGSSVYFLSYEATDEESRRVAAAENAPLATVPRPPGRDLEFILWDMAQAAYLAESAILAEILQEELVGNAGEENNRGIKQAPFRVLMGATMPAVLVEVAFITNPEEERLLRTEAFQDQLVEAVYRGVVRYKERFERGLGMGKIGSGKVGR